MTIKYRPRCFLDVEIGSKPVGRIVMELFSDICPLTCDNFRSLCTGEKGIGKTTQKPLHYKGVAFHRVVKDFMVQCGDFSAGNGTGGESIYGGTFKDECFDVKHDKPFLLSMANRGKDTNGSQFFITTQPAPHLDGVHVVFGHVISGQDVVSRIESERTDQSSSPLSEIKISNCGELVPKIKAKAKKRKRDASESSEEGESKSDSDVSDGKKKKKKKKKKKSKKHKKEKKKDSNEKSQREEGEIASDTEVVCSIKPEEVPEIPSSKFLMRRASPLKDSKEKVEDGQRRKNSYQRRQQVSRSGRKIKGRGFMRYRTPSRSRSRSRSFTPPHWRQAQARVVPLSEYQKRVQELEKDEPAGTSPAKQWDEREFKENEFNKLDEDQHKENGDHVSRKEVFDRESAAKESVSYPITYPKTYSTQSYDYNSYGDDWRAPLAENQSKSSAGIQEKSNYESVSSEKSKSHIGYHDENMDTDKNEERTSQVPASFGRQKFSSPTKPAENTFNKEKSSSPYKSRHFDKSSSKYSSKKKHSSRSSSSKNRDLDESPHRVTEKKDEQAPHEEIDTKISGETAKKFSPRRRSSSISPRRPTSRGRRDVRKSPKKGRSPQRSGSSSSPPRGNRNRGRGKDVRRGRRSESRSSSSDVGSRRRPRSGQARGMSPRHSEQQRPYRKRDSTSRSPSSQKRVLKRSPRSSNTEKSASPARKPEVVAQRKLVQDYSSPRANSSKSRSPSPELASKLSNKVDYDDKDSRDDKERSSALFSSEKFTTSSFAPVSEEQRGYSALETLHYQQQQQYQQQIDMEAEAAAERERSVSPPRRPPTPPREKKSANVYSEPISFQLDEILLPGETRDEGGVVMKTGDLPGPANAGNSLWKAIPEATQPTVEMSTLERLQRQQVSDDVTGKNENSEGDKKDERKEAFKGSLRSSSPRSRNRRSRSRSRSREDRRWGRRRSRSRSYQRRSASRSRSRSRGRRRGSPYRSWRRPPGRYRPPYIPKRRSSSGGKRRSPRRRKDRKDRSESRSRSRSRSRSSRDRRSRSKSSSKSTKS